jgi:uncharacterized protein YbjT (DUF2867 family)
VIVVAGGTGRLGSAVANRLSQAGLPVRVLSRGTSSAFELDSSIDVVKGDVRDPASVADAISDAALVVSAVHGFAGSGGVTPANVDRLGNEHLIGAAEAAGADVVLLSVLRASADNPMELARMKYAAEERLRASSCRWTIVRAEAFAQTWISLLEQTAAKSRRPLVFGDGRNPIGWVDVNDVAALVERVVIDSSLRGRVLEIAGPELISLADLAQLVISRNGWDGSPRVVPRAALHMMAQTVGRVRSDLGRKARASLAMDLMPAVDCADLRNEFPDLPATPVTAVVERHRTHR